MAQTEWPPQGSDMAPNTRAQRDQHRPGLGMGTSLGPPSAPSHSCLCVAGVVRGPRGPQAVQVPSQSRDQ